MSRAERRFTLLRPARAEADIGGWVLRGGVAVFFVLAGLEKFSTGPGNTWVAIFQQIGIGQWFRYFTGLVEIVGAVIYAFPRTCLIGAALLGCTMIGAMTVHIAVRHSVGSSLMPAALLVAIVAIALRQPDDSSDTFGRGSRPTGSRR